eukprot:m.328598 g.328598  ORF g.328598 m.328598 type:complete len:114 (+) comp55591_c0_seq16:292-633(+)
MSWKTQESTWALQHFFCTPLGVAMLTILVVLLLGTWTVQAHEQSEWLAASTFADLQNVSFTAFGRDFALSMREQAILSAVCLSARSIGLVTTARKLRRWFATISDLGGVPLTH